MGYRDDIHGTLEVVRVRHSLNCGPIGVALVQFLQYLAIRLVTSVQRDIVVENARLLSKRAKPQAPAWQVLCRHPIQVVDLHSQSHLLAAASG